MTDTAPPRTQYELVPGMTSYRLSAILSKVTIGVYAIAGAGLLLWYILSGMVPANRITLGLIFVGVSLAWTVVSFRLQRSRDAAENAAGYTTRAGALHGFDQVDPVSGVVIRGAGSAVLTKPERRTRSGGLRDGGAAGAGSGLSAGAVLNGAPSGEPRFTESPSARSLRLFSIVFVVVVVVFVPAFAVVSTAVSGGDTEAAVIVVSLVYGCLALTFAIAYGAPLVRARLKTRAVARLRPDAFVFLSRRTPELEGAIEEGAGADGTLFGRTFAVSVGAAGVELWRGPADAPIAAFGWKAISHVHPGGLLVEVNDRMRTARTIHIFLGDDARLDAPLPVYGARGILFAGSERANSVLDAFRRYTKIV